MPVSGSWLKVVAKVSGLTAKGIAAGGRVVGADAAGDQIVIGVGGRGVLYVDQVGHGRADDVGAVVGCGKVVGLHGDGRGKGIVGWLGREVAWAKAAGGGLGAADEGRDRGHGDRDVRRAEGVLVQVVEGAGLGRLAGERVGAPAGGGVVHVEGSGADDVDVFAVGREGGAGGETTEADVGAGAGGVEIDRGQGIAVRVLGEAGR